MAGLSGTEPIYATADDLKVYLGSEESPADVPDADALLARASRDVRNATRAAVYRTDANRMPTLDVVRDAMHDATVIQAAALFTTGWKRQTTPTVAKPAVASKSLGGASVSYVKSDAQTRAEALAAGDLDGYAIQVLEDAGLLSTQVQSARAYPVRPLARVRGLL
ncbi:head-to-tail adaptor [Microbacterium phage Warren]|nr:head-to-tail adaptor [Microbacterium phage Warren]